MKRAHLLFAPMVAAAFAAGMPHAAAAQTAPAPMLGLNATLLTIAAEGKVARTPDIAGFSAGVISHGKTASEALAANAFDMNRVIAALKHAGIADKDIQTANLSLNPVYAPQRSLPDGTIDPPQPRIIGYQASNTINVRQRNLKAYGMVIDTLVAAGANQVNGPSFEVENPEPTLDAARTSAMQKARARAELYARAAGLKVNRILSINENGGWAPPQPVMYRMAAMEAAGAPPPSPFEAGQLQMTMNVTVQFELVP